MMKKILFLLLLAPCLWADGPRFKHTDKNVDQEFVNVYQDIRNAGGSVSDPLTLSGLIVSTITASSATIMNASISNLVVSVSTITSLHVNSISGVSLGKVLQVVSTQTTTATSTTSTSFVDTGLIGTITPRSATSFIAIFAFGRLTSPSNGNNAEVTISDSGGSLLGTTGQCTALEGSGTVSIRESCAMHVVDTSITASPQNYKARLLVTGGTGIFNENLGSGVATMLIVEYNPS